MKFSYDFTRLFYTLTTLSIQDLHLVVERVRCFGRRYIIAYIELWIFVLRYSSPDLVIRPATPVKSSED